MCVCILCILKWHCTFKFLYTAKMFYALDYGPAQNLINLFHTAKKTRCQQLQIIMTRCKMGSIKVTVLICNGTVVLLVTDCQPLIMSKKLRFSYYRSGWLRAEAYKEGKKEWCAPVLELLLVRLPNHLLIPLPCTNPRPVRAIDFRKSDISVAVADPETSERGVQETWNISRRIR